jgi:hypothetical protein
MIIFETSLRRELLNPWDASMPISVNFLWEGKQIKTLILNSSNSTLTKNQPTSQQNNQSLSRQKIGAFYADIMDMIRFLSA